MPAPLVHLAFARSYLKQRPELSELELIRGTTFPDIRLMAKLPRSQTHQYGLAMSEVDAETDPWKAGMLLHSYLDEAWYAILTQHGETEGSHDRLFWFAVKQAEEADFYGQVRDNRRMVPLFEAEPLPQELAFDVEPEVIRRWNRFMNWKLQTQHTINDWAHQAERSGRNQGEIQQVLDTVRFVLHDAAWQDMFKQLHSELGIEEEDIARS